MKRTKKIIYFTVFNFIAVIFLLVLIECTVRIIIKDIRPLGSDSSLFKNNVFDKSVGLEPGAQGMSYGVKMTVDERGFWKYKSKVDTGNERKNWLILGDSVTMGIGVEQEDSFAGLLNNILKDSLGVINPSVIKYQVKDYYNTVKGLSEKNVSFKKITLVWCLNDVYADLDTKGTIGMSGNRIIGYFHKNIYTYQWLKNLLTDRSADYYRHDIQFYSENSPYIIRSAELLDSIRTVAESHGAVFELWIMPYLYQLKNGLRDDLDHFISALEEKRISYIDFRDVLDGYDDPKELYLYGDGIHFSKKGHNAVAVKYLEILREGI